MRPCVSVEPRPWSRGHRWGVVASVFALQLGLILWLGNRAPLRPRLPGPVPVLHCAPEDSSQLLTLGDPTVFALPHRHGFSGLAWLSVQPRESPPFDWPDAPEELALSVQQLGAAFNQFLQTNSFKSLTLPESVPALSLPPLWPVAEARERSEFHLEEDLAKRKLLVAPTLRSWEHTNLLANTVVRLVVDDDGIPVSFTLLGSSGFKAADQHALAQARSARFEPTPRRELSSETSPLKHLAWGRMVFEWHTLPVPVTPATNN